MQNKNRDHKTMSLFSHLHELRSRLIIALLAIIIIFILAMFFIVPIINFLEKPLLRSLPLEQRSLHFTGPLDVFITSIKVSMLTAIVTACPIWLYQFWRFIEPALYPKERKLVLPFFYTSIILFVVGILFCFYLILPLALDFLITLGLEVGTPIITITDYMSLLTLLIIGFGLIFETPLVLIMLASVELISAHTLSKYRRYVIVGVLVLGALLTPPDPLSQVGMAIPLYIMYEISILIIRAMELKRR